MLPAPRRFRFWGCGPAGPIYSACGRGVGLRCLPFPRRPGARHPRHPLSLAVKAVARQRPRSIKALLGPLGGRAVRSGPGIGSNACGIAGGASSPLSVPAPRRRPRSCGAPRRSWAGPASWLGLVGVAAWGPPLEALGFGARRGRGDGTGVGVVRALGRHQAGPALRCGLLPAPRPARGSWRAWRPPWALVPGLPAAPWKPRPVSRLSGPAPRGCARWPLRRSGSCGAGLAIKGRSRRGRDLPPLTLCGLPELVKVRAERPSIYGGVLAAVAADLDELRRGAADQSAPAGPRAVRAASPVVSGSAAANAILR